MGDLSQVKAEPSKEFSGLEGCSSIKLNDKSERQLAVLLAQMSAGFPHQEFAAETVEMYTMAFRDLAIRHGLNTLTRVLKSFLTRQKFFPHPSEVAEVCEEEQRQRQHEARQRLPRLGCAKCEGRGMVLVTDEKNRRTARRCECWIAREAANAQLSQETDCYRAGVGHKSLGLLRG